MSKQLLAKVKNTSLEYRFPAYIGIPEKDTGMPETDKNNGIKGRGC